MEKIIIIDGLNFIYKGAIKFKKDEGKISNESDFTLVSNFFRNIRALVERLNPSKIFLAKEGKSCFRYSLFEGYKANRLIKTASKSKEETDNFNRQRDIIFDLIKYLPITVVQSDNYEADDVIYSLTDDLKDEEVIIVSNDSDLIQILQKEYKNVKIFNPFTNSIVEPPKYFILVYKSLAGDKSDNIPGILGKAKALKLTNDPELLKNYLDNNEEARIKFNDNLNLIKLRLIPINELVFVDHQISFDFLKNEFKNMKFDTLIKTDYWKKFVGTFKNIKL